MVDHRTTETEDPSAIKDVGPNFVEIVRVHERSKTVRTIAVGIIVLLSIITIVIGVVKVADKPPWLTLCLAIVVALIGPSGVIYQLIRSRKKYVEKTHRRTARLEKELDVRRSSSDPVASHTESEPTLGECKGEDQRKPGG